MGKQGVFLEYGIKLALVWRKLAYILTVEDHLSLIGSLKTAYDPQGGGFAAAAGA